MDDISLWFWTAILGVALVVFDWALGVLYPHNKNLAKKGLYLGIILIIVSLGGIVYPLLKHRFFSTKESFKNKSIVKRSPFGIGGAGGNSEAKGKGSHAYAGHGGKGGITGNGGAGGNAKVEGEGSESWGGNGGDAGQSDGRGGRGGQSPIKRTRLPAGAGRYVRGRAE